MMLFSLAIIVLFVVISVYYYFRSEKLIAELKAVKKEASQIKKESKMMIDAFAVVAQKNEDFIHARFTAAQSERTDNESVVLLTPLVTNYATIFRESIRGKGEMHKVVKKCCENFQPGSYKRLTTYINSQDAQVKRAWNSNNLKGFIVFMETMILGLTS
ncbi:MULTISPECIES: hypothetical protein [Thalassotalea]|uniref:LemA family protein n=1 Tax=Thalassotalea castellviae TaxID=3075612 RepID=A0ABU3A561_9GAMM|nr:hypothetical protein [Thalassotalea sp. W431]MDT0605322.1 hypothetical protein [Thalassotalea sp. W431]